MNPIRNQVYTARQILTEMSLKDSPFFKFWRQSPFQRINDGKDAERLALMAELSFDEDVDCVLQTGHVTDEQLLSVPGFADSRWSYISTTYEWVPLFVLESHTRDDVALWFDLEHEIGNYGQLINSWSVTPKGFPQEQYFADPANLWQNHGCHRDFPVSHRKLHMLTGMSWPESEESSRPESHIPETSPRVPPGTNV